jgi:hypothetical protein
MGGQLLKLQALTCSELCTSGFPSSLLFLTNAITARTSTNALRETVIEVKLIPIGDNPKNKPSSPIKPKLKATDNTSCSMMSILFLPKNRIFTRQYPGTNTMRIVLRTYRGIKLTEKSGVLGIR